MVSDEAVERYLNAVSSYESAKLSASQSWKKAFLELAKARLSTDVSSDLYDASSPACVHIASGNKVAVSSNTSPMMGAWPSSSLRSARELFIDALKHEIEAREAYIQQRDAIP